MGHFAEFDQTKGTAPVVPISWTMRDLRKENELRTGVCYRKTRSTIALSATDLIELKEDEITDTYKSLLRLSKFLNREEIVIECLEELSKNCKYESLKECLDLMKSDIIRTSRQMNICQPRVALEKRGRHFDLRIYPNFH